ncbi:MAG: phosphate signaling complex protein PhoU [Lachnospiraceae bacterium]|nr:phosphate signaling complex protein PhoU [Lachnospiraceae bacterium]
MTPRVVFEQELEQLKVAVTDMSERAEISYDKLVLAVNGDDRGILEQLLHVDHAMTDMQRNIEARCLRLLTKQQPVARDLRVVSAALKVVTDIQRVGDIVTDMAELFLRMPQPLDLQRWQPLIGFMMQETKEMLHGAVECFVNSDQQQAQEVIDHDDVIDEAFNRMKEEMMEAIRSGDVDADKSVDMLMIAKYLEKIGDHAVNIGKWAIFQTTGDMESYRLL